jgi:hypothetical protein
MSALTTDTYRNQREKEKEKKRIKRNSNIRPKAKEGKEQDHLKKTSLGPLMQGQRLDTSETKPCSNKEHKPPKHTRAPPAHMHTPPEQVPTLGTNWSGRFPKPVRPVPPKPVRPVTKIGQTGSTKTGQTGSTKTDQAGYQNRSDWFHQNRSGRLPKSVRPIGYSRPHPPKAKNAK